MRKRRPFFDRHEGNRSLAPCCCASAFVHLPHLSCGRAFFRGLRLPLLPLFRPRSCRARGAGLPAGLGCERRGSGAGAVVRLADGLSHARQLVPGSRGARGRAARELGVPGLPAAGDPLAGGGAAAARHGAACTARADGVGLGRRGLAAQAGEPHELPVGPAGLRRRCEVRFALGLGCGRRRAGRLLPGRPRVRRVRLPGRLLRLPADARLRSRAPGWRWCWRSASRSASASRCAARTT